MNPPSPSPNPQTPEAKLRAIAEKAGLTFRQMNEMFQAAMISDEKTRHRMIEQRKQEVEYMQLQLMQVQYRNEMMSNELLTAKLRRHVARLKMWQKVTGLFRPSQKQTGRIVPSWNNANPETK